MVKDLPKYYVFLDCNAMLGRHWVKSALFEQIRQLRGEQLARVRFYIPGVVHQEWSRHYIDAAQQHIRNVLGSQRELQRMSVDTVELASIEEADLQAKADKILKQNFINVFETPYNSIDWPHLIDRAVRHVPPFEPDSDKGIKDAIIAHTIHAYHEKHKRRKLAQIVAITADDTLRKYLEEILDTEALVTFDTVEDFASSLRLSVDELSSDLLSKAKETFYTAGDNESFYYTGDIFKTIRDNYDSLLGDSPSAEAHIRKIPSEKISGTFGLPNDNSWAPLDHKCFITGTSFIKRGGGRLHWATTITYKQAYALSTQNYDGMVFNSPTAVIHVVQFEINWSSQLRSGHALTAPGIASVKLVDESAIVEMFPGIDYEKGTTNLTRPSNFQGLSTAYAQSISQQLTAAQSSMFNSSLASSINAIKQSLPSAAAIKSIQDLVGLGLSGTPMNINGTPMESGTEKDSKRPENKGGADNGSRPNQKNDSK